MMAYVVSKFVSIFERDDLIALHHNCTRTTKYFDANVFRTLERVGFQPTKIDEASKQSIELLIANQLVVSCDVDESARYAQWVADLQHRAKPGMSVLYIFPTLHCNFNCRYCVIENNLSESQKGMKLDFETAKRAIDLFFCTPPSDQERTIIFYGGEPLLHPDIVFKCIEYIEDKAFNDKLDLKKINFTINTNGSLINESIMRFLARRTNVSLAISLDGEAEDNDKMRVYHDGKGTYNDVIAKIRLLETQKINYGISFTVGEHNLQRLEENVFHLLSQLNTKGIGFNIMHAFEEGTNPGFSDMTKRIDLIKKVQAVGEMLFDQKGIQEDKTFFRRWNMFHDKSCATCYLRDCAGMGEQMVVSPSGKIGPCHAFIGSENYFVDMNSITQCIHDHPNWEIWAKCSPPYVRYCTDQFCKDIDFCGGGCPYEAEIANGDLYKPLDDYCRFVRGLKEMYVWKKYNVLVARSMETSHQPIGK